MSGTNLVLSLFAGAVGVCHSSMHCFQCLSHCLAWLWFLLPRSCLYTPCGLHLAHDWPKHSSLGIVIRTHTCFSLRVWLIASVSEVLLAPCSTSLCLMYHWCWLWLWLWLFISPRQLPLSTHCALSSVTAYDTIHVGIAKSTVVSFTQAQWFYSGV